MKSGIKTTEFWMVIVASLLAVVTAAGILTPTEATEIENATASVINSVTELVTALTPLIGVVSYVWSRTKVKVGK